MTVDVDVGTVLGERYRIVRPIGRGGMGSVWEALQLDLERPVAVKVLDPVLARDAEGLRRFQREAKAAAALSHPSIVQVTDFSAPSVAGAGPAYLVMDLLRGESLAARIRGRGRLPPERVAHIGMQVLDGLEVAHAAGVVHRDVKPDNVFLTQAAGSEDVVKVLDFGVAKLVQPASRDPAMASTALTALGAVVGTPEYMAPEQARGRDVDPRTDLYALGATLYHALSGRVPFAAPSVNALLFAIVEDPPAPLSSLRAELDPALVAVIDRAMAKRPDDRYQTAAEFRDALMPFVGQPYSAPGKVPSTAKTGEAPRGAPAASAGPATTTSGAAAMVPVAKARGRAWPIVAAVAVAAAAAVVLVRERKSPPTPPPSAPAAPAVASTTGAVGASATTDPTAPSASPTAAPVASAPSTPSAVPSPGAGAAKVGDKTPVAVAASASPSAVSSVTKAKAPTGGRTVVLKGGILGEVVTWDEMQRLVGEKKAALDACYVAAEYDPVDHRGMDYHLDVEADGHVRAVSWYSTPRPLTLDPCMIKVLSGLKLPAGRAGLVKLLFSSPTH